MLIRDLKEKDVAGMLEWIKDPRTAEWSQIEQTKQTEETILRFIRENRENTIHKAVTDENDNYLGTVSLKNIDQINKSAEYAISMRYSAHGTGAAQYGTKEIFRYGFEQLGLERIYWYVFSDNERANRFYTKIGAHYEGEFRQALCVNGVFHNIKWYSVLKAEYKDI